MKQYDGRHPTIKQAENKSPNSEAKNRGMLALANKGANWPHLFYPSFTLNSS
jgi:hypothetical protein